MHNNNTINKELKWAYEGAAVRQNQDNKRMFILNILLIVLLILTNGFWIYYESQFMLTEVTTIEASQDGEGINLIGTGDISYGAESYDN